MRIVLDGIPLCAPKTGVGHYTYELACALARNSPADYFELVSPFAFLAGADSSGPASLPGNLSTRFVETNFIERRWFSVGLPRYIKNSRLELFHGTNYEVPLRRVCPSVMTIHDLSLFLFPETHLSRRVWRARSRLPLMVRRATMIITPTESVRTEVRNHFHLPADKVIAIGEAPRRIFQPSTPDEVRSVTERLGIQGDFLLAVGTIEPRKNLKTLVRAFSELHRSLATPPQLVIVGKDGWLTESFYSQIKESEAAECIKMTGYVTDSDLRALYSSCRAFVYPSVYEGFGLPPLEAMACGAPVIASRIPSLNEVLSDAALFFEACDVRQLKEALAALLGQDPLREKLREAGRKRSSLFKWEKAAYETARVYCEAVERFNVAKTAARSWQRNLWRGKT